MKSARSSSAKTDMCGGPSTPIAQVKQKSGGNLKERDNQGYGDASNIKEQGRKRTRAMMLQTALDHGKGHVEDGEAQKDADERTKNEYSPRRIRPRFNSAHNVMKGIAREVRHAGGLSVTRNTSAAGVTRSSQFADLGIFARADADYPLYYRQINPELPLRHPRPIRGAPAPVLKWTSGMAVDARVLDPPSNAQDLGIIARADADYPLYYRQINPELPLRHPRPIRGAPAPVLKWTSGMAVDAPVLGPPSNAQPIYYASSLGRGLATHQNGHGQFPAPRRLTDNEQFSRSFFTMQSSYLLQSSLGLIGPTTITTMDSPEPLALRAQRDKSSSPDYGPPQLSSDEDMCE